MNNANGHQSESSDPTASNGKQAGAPKGNANRTTHGLRGFLTLGTYPKGGGYVRKLLGQFREALEAEILTRHSEVSIFHAALIQSAARHEGRALLLNRWLRTEADLSVSDRLAIVKGITDASDSRDRCLKLLGLDQSAKSESPWAQFDRERLLPANPPAANPPIATASDPTPANGSAAEPTPPNATATTLGDVAGNGEAKSESRATA